MRAKRRRWLAAVVAAGAVAALATQAAAATAGPTPNSVTPVGRAVELMGAFKAHRYVAACDVYDPAFWEMLGFGSGSCAGVLRKTFPRSDPVAYRVEFGGKIGPHMAVVLVSMALGDAALLCDKVWQGAQHCPDAGTYYLELTQKTLLVDWRGREVDAPLRRWYVTSIGDV